MTTPPNHAALQKPVSLACKHAYYFVASAATYIVLFKHITKDMREGFIWLCAQRIAIVCTDVTFPQRFASEHIVFSCRYCLDICAVTKRNHVRPSACYVAEFSFISLAPWRHERRQPLEPFWPSARLDQEGSSIQCHFVAIVLSRPPLH